MFVYYFSGYFIFDFMRETDRKKMEKYGGKEGYGIVQAAKRTAKPLALTAQALKMGIATGFGPEERKTMRTIAAAGLDKYDERRKEIENLYGGKSKKLHKPRRKSRKTRRKSNNKRSTKRSRK